jgi:hypothetical protein
MYFHDLPQKAAFSMPQKWPNLHVRDGWPGKFFPVASSDF